MLKRSSGRLRRGGLAAVPGRCIAARWGADGTGLGGTRRGPSAPGYQGWGLAWRRTVGRAWGWLALYALHGMAQAVAPPWQPLMADEWPAVQAQLPRPALVLFTAQTCAVCPQVLADIQRSLRARAVRVTQGVVFMDAAPSTAQADAFKHLDRRWVLRGPEFALRYRVHPAWRGEMPYVVLLDRRGGAQYGVGLPPPAALDAWLAPGEGIARPQPCNGAHEPSAPACP